MEKHHMSQIRLAAAIILLGSGFVPATADTAGPGPAPPTIENARNGTFPQQTGEAIYKGVCQGCHMADAKGAVAAGAYPALANNSNLAVAGYPIGVVIHGQKAMPPFDRYFTDVQIANVINYVRSNFGNDYTDKVTPEDVKAQR
jgi:mono/diheme cytochrome c family protein